MRSNPRCRQMLSGSLIFLVLAVFVPAATSLATETEEERAPGLTMADQATKAKKVWITVDHSRIEALQKDFTSGPQVTRARSPCASSTRWTIWPARCSSTICRR